MRGKRGPNQVYFIKPIGLDGPIKIGHSDFPLGRLSGLSAWSPLPLEIIGAVLGTLQDERFLHECFSTSYSHREWFHVTLPLQQAIKRILAAGSIDAVRETLPPRGKVPQKPRTPATEDQKLQRDYAGRIRRTERKLRASDGKGPWSAPRDVDAIISRWRGPYRGTPISPSKQEIARLDEYLANPQAHSVIPSWQLPKDPICVPHIAEAA